MATHSCIFAWRIPWTREPGRLWSVRSQWVRNDWVTELRWHPPPPWEVNPSTSHIFACSPETNLHFHDHLWLQTPASTVFAQFSDYLTGLWVQTLFISMRFGQNLNPLPPIPQNTQVTANEDVVGSAKDLRRRGTAPVTWNWILDIPAHNGDLCLGLFTLQTSPYLLSPLRSSLPPTPHQPPHWAASGILVPQAGIEPRSQQ